MCRTALGHAPFRSAACGGDLCLAWLLLRATLLDRDRTRCQSLSTYVDYEL